MENAIGPLILAGPKEMIKLEQDMKDAEAALEKKGYNLIRYDEFEHESNDEVAHRYLMVFEKVKG